MDRASDTLRGGWIEAPPASESLHRPGRLKGDFDALKFSETQSCIVRRPSGSELPQLLARVGTAIGVQLAACDLVERVAVRDPESIWAFERRGEIVGGFAFLFLTAEGVTRMCGGQFNMKEPDLDYLVSAEESPAGIYLWALLARARAASALPRLLAMLQGPRFCKADLWAAPVTRDGERFVRQLGFVNAECAAFPNLRRYVRHANRGSRQ